MIIKHWLNGRTIKWIADKENINPLTVINEIKRVWNVEK